MIYYFIQKFKKSYKHHVLSLYSRNGCAAASIMTRYVYNNPPPKPGYRYMYIKSTHSTSKCIPGVYMFDVGFMKALAGGNADLDQAIKTSQKIPIKNTNIWGGGIHISNVKINNTSIKTTQLT